MFTLKKKFKFIVLLILHLNQINKSNNHSNNKMNSKTLIYFASQKEKSKNLVAGYACKYEFACAAGKLAAPKIDFHKSGNAANFHGSLDCQWTSCFVDVVDARCCNGFVDFRGS